MDMEFSLICCCCCCSCYCTRTRTHSYKFSMKHITVLRLWKLMFYISYLSIECALDLFLLYEKVFLLLYCVFYWGSKYIREIEVNFFGAEKASVSNIFMCAYS